MWKRHWSWMMRTWSEAKNQAPIHLWISSTHIGEGFKMTYCSSSILLQTGMRFSGVQVTGLHIVNDIQLTRASVIHLAQQRTEKQPPTLFIWRCNFNSFAKSVRLRKTTMYIFGCRRDNHHSGHTWVGASGASYRQTHLAQQGGARSSKWPRGTVQAGGRAVGVRHLHHAIQVIQ